MKFLKPLPLAACALALALHTPLFAAEPDPDPTPPAVTTAPGEATVMEAIVVTGEAAPYAAGDSSSATGLAISVSDTPQSITVITRERIEDQNLQSLRDVLDNTPGVYSYAYDSERVVFSSRGFTIDSVLYDGVPATSNFNTGSADETLDTALYERVEIVRGATGLMTGTGSPSASVNLVRKHADSRTFTASTDLTLGSWNDQRAVVDASLPLTASGNVRARVVGVYQDRESYQDLYENQKTVFYGVIDADLSPDTTLTLGYDYQDNNAGSNTWGSFPLYLADGSLANWDRSVTTATDWSFWDKTKQTGFAELRHRFANGWSLNSTVSHRVLKEDMDLFYVYGFPDPVDGTGLVPFEYRANGDVKQNALDVHAAGPFEFLGREHELLLGYNGSRVDIQSELFNHTEEELPPVGNFFEWDGSYPQPTHLPGVNIADIENTQHGVYAAARFSLLDSLKLIAGARYMKVKSDYFYVYSGSFKQDHSKTTPYAGVIYDLSADWSAFASYTTIFNTQNAREENGTYLDPMEGKSAEIGIKGEHFNGHLNTALTLFDTRQDNVAEALVDADGAPVYVIGTKEDERIQASRAIDGTQTRGFELEASGSPLAGLNLSLGWSRYLLEDGDSNAIRNWTPRTLIRSFMSWTPQGLSKLTVGGGVRWQSRSTATVEAPAGLTDLRQASVTLVGLMARWQFTPALSAQLNGENLLDRKYYVLDEYSNLYYGEPSSAAASVSYRF